MAYTKAQVVIDLAEYNELKEKIKVLEEDSRGCSKTIQELNDRLNISTITLTSFKEKQSDILKQMLPENTSLITFDTTVETKEKL